MAYTKLDVWKKATVVPNVDSTKWRKDQCGAWIGWEYYGDRSSDYGWEIDHITPVSKGVPYPRVVPILFPTFVRFNGRTTPPDKTTVCVARLRRVETRT